MIRTAISSSVWPKACLLGIVLAVGAVGCARKPTGVTPIPGGGGSIRGSGDMFGPEESGRVPLETDLTSTTEVPLPPEGPDGMRRDKNYFRDSSVYFDFDRSAIKASERPKIEQVSSYLRANPTHKIQIEGHCDERGTEGYNMALGSRRANAIRDYLINLGIRGDRIYPISFGESVPADPGHDEIAWAKNRRGEFILLTPP